MAVRNGKVEKAPVLVRAVKFEIKPTDQQLETMIIVSRNMRQIWNYCLLWRQDYFNEHLKPLYDVLKEAKKEKDPNLVSSTKKQIKDLRENAPVYHVAGNPERSQASWLTRVRQDKNDFEACPCPWQQETLKILKGSFTSFAQLRNRGDTDARPPRAKEEGSFCELQGVKGWQLLTNTLKINPQKSLEGVYQTAMQQSDGMDIILSPGKALPGGAVLNFPIPDYQRLILSLAVKLNKFTLYKDKKKKRFWISIAYSLPKPEQTTLVPEEVVFVAMGASYIGVVSKKGEEVIDLWRPDKHWMPKIIETKTRMKKGVLRPSPHPQTNSLDFEANPMRNPVKGSRSWVKRKEAVGRMYEKMRLQQLQNQHEVVVGRLKSHGRHFVLIEHSPIRSKQGALADKQKTDRGGVLGLNWSAQNTGSMARLKQILKQKTAEWGGSLSTIKLETDYPAGDPRERKVLAAKLARTQYLEVS